MYKEQFFPIVIHLGMIVTPSTKWNQIHCLSVVNSRLNKNLVCKPSLLLFCPNSLQDSSPSTLSRDAPVDPWFAFLICLSISPRIDHSEHSKRYLRFHITIELPCMVSTSGWSGVSARPVHLKLGGGLDTVRVSDEASSWEHHVRAIVRSAVLWMADQKWRTCKMSFVYEILVGKATVSAGIVWNLWMVDGNILIRLTGLRIGTLFDFQQDIKM